MIALALLLPLTAVAQDPAPTPYTGLMSGLYEPEQVAPLRVGHNRVALPLVSRSLREPRALAEDGVITLWLPAGLDAELQHISLRGLRHRTDQRVLDSAEGWVLAGAPLPPRTAQGVDAALLLRHDGYSTRLAGASFDAPEGAHARVLIPKGRGLALVQAADAKLPPGDAAFDQLYFTAAVPSAVQGTPLETATLGGQVAIASGRQLLASIPAPDDLAEGQTWTLLIEFNAAFVPVAPSAKRSSSPFDLLRERRLPAPFVHMEGPDLQMDIRPTMGPGAAWGDVNGDGYMDLYLVQGAGREHGPALRNRLYLGKSPLDFKGSFTDGTAAANIGHTGAGMGALFFDVEGDGDLDLYLANYGPDVLYLNDGEGHFTDVTSAAGIDFDVWSASVSAADYDGDGDLDLYVTAYLDYDTDKMPPVAELDRYQRDDPIEMLPFAFPGQRNALYRNDSGPDGVRFTDVAAELGVANPEGRSMQSLWWDFDRDGDQDLYVANDVSLNVLYRNDGGTFTDITFAVGLDDPRGGMGLAAGDLDRDGDEDLLLTNWNLETNALYLNNAVARRSGRTRRARFHDGTLHAGLGPSGIGKTSWSPVLFDVDLDGDLDLFVANGYTSPDYETTGICVGQQDQLFINDGRGRFREQPAISMLALLPAHVSRAAVPCDFDRDGDIDLIVTANNGPARLLVGTAADRGLGQWIGIRLHAPGKNPYAVGAEITVRRPDGSGKLLRRGLRAGSGYLGSPPLELHFGLGDWDAKNATIEVRWPNGKETTHALPTNAWHTIER